MSKILEEYKKRVTNLENKINSLNEVIKEKEETILNLLSRIDYFNDKNSELIINNAKIDVKKKDNVWIMEKKVIGKKLFLTKNASEVKLLDSDGNNYISLFNNILFDAYNISKLDYVLDGYLVLKNNRTKQALSEKEIEKYLKKELKETTNISPIYYVYDCVYSTNMKLSSDLYKRKRELESFEFTRNIKKVYSLAANNKRDAKKIISLFSKLNGSEGVIVREYSSSLRGKENKYIYLVE